MHKIIQHIFHGKVTPVPKVVLNAFKSVFKVSRNVEWHREKDNFEALFYTGNMEQIALFSPEGTLIEKKCNLALSKVTPPVAAQANAIGELMNLIEITRGDERFYEIIVRDENLNRYYLLLEADGNLLDRRKL